MNKSKAKYEFLLFGMVMLCEAMFSAGKPSVHSIQNTVIQINDTLNKRNANGKKQGTWFVFLDKHTIPTDSAGAYFIGLEYYENGEQIRGVFYNRPWKAKDSIVYSFVLPEKGKPVLLSGTIQWYGRKKNTSVLLVEEKYVNGQAVSITENSYTSSKHGVVRTGLEFADFTRTNEMYPGSFYFEVSQGQEGTSDIKVSHYWCYKSHGKIKTIRIVE